MVDKKYLIYVLISAGIFFAVCHTDKKYETLFKDETVYTGTAEVVSFAEEKEYTKKYIIKINGAKIIAYTSKNIELEYGDIISFKGNFEMAETARNDKGFNYQRYLRQSRIYGIIMIEDVSVLKETRGIKYKFYKFKNDLENRVKELYNEDEAGFLSGILLRQ